MKKITQEAMMAEIKRCLEEVSNDDLENESKEVETNMILGQYTFYSKMLMQMRKEFVRTDQYPAAVTIKNARWHLNLAPSYLNNHWSFQERVGVYVHEIEHLVRNHFLRGERANVKPGHQDWELWLIACDLEINQSPVENVPGPPWGINHNLYKLPAGKTAEQYLNLLREMREEQQEEKGDQDEGNSQDGDGSGSGKSDGQDNPEEGEEGSSPRETQSDDSDDEEGDGSENTGGGQGSEGDKQEDQQSTNQDVPENQPATDSKGRPWLPQPGEDSGVNSTWVEIEKEADGPMVTEMLKEIVNEAVSRSQGKIPGHLEGAIADLNRPNKIHWTKYLHRYVNNAVLGKKASSWSIPNRRLPCLPVKGKKKTHGVCVVFAIDTSGSIRRDEIAQAMAELKSIAKLEEAECHVVECDAAIAWSGKLQDANDVHNIQFAGGGGTAFEPVFEWIEKEMINPDVLIYMTDGYGSYPDSKPPYQTIWLKVEGAKISVPWGLQVEYPKHK